jgi:predicted 2-oxoglutarate/Fe(II)-dependent dioxygenase YbiX
MPQADFFRRLGVFTCDTFLDNHLCCTIQEEMQLSQSEPARLNRDGIERVDEAIRRTKIVTVSQELTQFVNTQLVKIKPQIESHFNVKLDEPEEPHFLSYREGDFFKLHQDSEASDEANTVIQKRYISVVIFLNREMAAPALNSYAGGSLILYGLLHQPQWENYGFAVQGAPGMLIAFPANVYHEVTSVTQGRRFTIVTWFPAVDLAIADGERVFVKNQAIEH